MATRSGSERRVSALPAKKAHVCGAAGCRETESLLSIDVDGVRRVLCESHAEAWIPREFKSEMW